jgi:prophage tail gpP-like protein
MPEVTLRLGRRLFSGWKQALVEYQLGSVAAHFQLQVSEKWAQQHQPWPIEAGDKCTLDLAGDRVLTGYIDRMERDYDAQQHQVTLVGRSLTGDLIDCGCPSIEWRGRRLAAIARSLCQPFGITVQDQVGLSQVFQHYKPAPAVSCFEALAQGAKHHGVWLTTNPQGDLVITRAGKVRQPGGDINRQALRVQAVQDASIRFNQYTVLGQAQPDPWATEVASAHHKQARVRDQQVTRHRPLILLAEGQLSDAAARDRALWERNRRAGQSRQAVYTLQGWQTPSRALWQLNHRLRLTDPTAQLQQADRLIAGVKFTLDDQGSRTALTLAPPQAFELLATPEVADSQDNPWAM